jgi:hypothetical protein
MYQQPAYGPQPPAYGPPPQAYGPPKGQHSGMVTAGGILNIIGGVLALGFFLWMIMIWMAAVNEAEELGADVEFVGLFGLGMICLIMPIIGAIFAIIGGIAALKRKSWGLALAGSIIGLIFGGGIFCLIALILIAIGKDEFE